MFKKWKKEVIDKILNEEFNDSSAGFEKKFGCSFKLENLERQFYL